jgi:hypothetical protein
MGVFSICIMAVRGIGLPKVTNMKVIGEILDWLWPRSPNDVFYLRVDVCEECGQAGAIYLWHGIEACEDCMRFHLAKARGAVCKPGDPGFADSQKTPENPTSKPRRISRREKLERGAYSAMLRARTPSAWRDLPAMISIPDGNPRKSPSPPTNEEKL